MPEIYIAAAKPKDARRIVQLAWEIWPEWYNPVIGPEQIAFMLDGLYQEEMILSNMQQDREYYLVSDNLADIGFLCIRKAGVFRVENLYLKKDKRGVGTGKRMLTFIEKLAESSGFQHIQLNVNRFNPSLQFYLHQGFAIREIVDIPFGPFSLNDFIMEKSLPITQKTKRC